MTDPVNLLKPYLFEALPEKFELNEGEHLADALVVVRIVSLDEDGQRIRERYEYTTSRDLSFAAGVGMIEIIREELRSVTESFMGADDVEEDDDGD